MKRFLISVLVLCVVAPVSFGSDEYTWVGSNGNFTDASWTVKTDAAYVSQGWVAPAIPYENQTYIGTSATISVQSRPQITNSSTITVNTDVVPLGVGFSQGQLDKGSLIIDAGGKYMIATGYQTCGQKATSYADGFALVVQNGGQYVNAGVMASASDSQKGTLMTYTTANTYGHVIISGAGTIFDSRFVSGGRAGQTQVRHGMLEVQGAGSTINIGSLSPSGNNVTMNYKFVTDVTGAVSKVNIDTLLSFKQGYSASHTANVSLLELVLNAAPTVGDQIVLFDLTDAAVRTGLLGGIAGNLVSEGGTVMGLLGPDQLTGTKYYFSLTYAGGESGNDVILTAVPEPATMALLSLGGLLLARKRRA